MSRDRLQPRLQPGSVAFVRVVITGREMDNSFIPSIPVHEINDKGEIMLSGYAHPDAVVTPEEIRMKLLTSEGKQ